MPNPARKSVTTSARASYPTSTALSRAARAHVVVDAREIDLAAIGLVREDDPIPRDVDHLFERPAEGAGGRPTACTGRNAESIRGAVGRVRLPVIAGLTEAHEGAFDLEPVHAAPHRNQLLSVPGEPIAGVVAGNAVGGHALDGADVEAPADPDRPVALPAVVSQREAGREAGRSRRHVERHLVGRRAGVQRRLELLAEAAHCPGPAGEADDVGAHARLLGVGGTTRRAGQRQRDDDTSRSRAERESAAT